MFNVKRKRKSVEDMTPAEATKAAEQGLLTIREMRVLLQFAEQASFAQMMVNDPKRP